MSKPAHVTLRRGYLIGYSRVRAKARAELRALSDHWDAELTDLQHNFHALADELHRDRHDRALDEAIIQRALSPDTLLH